MQVSLSTRLLSAFYIFSYTNPRRRVEVWWCVLCGRVCLNIKRQSYKIPLPRCRYSRVSLIYAIVVHYSLTTSCSRFNKDGQECCLDKISKQNGKKHIQYRLNNLSAVAIGNNFNTLSFIALLLDRQLKRCNQEFIVIVCVDAVQKMFVLYF